MQRTVIHRNKKKSWFQSPVVAIFLIIFLCWGMVVVYKIYRKHHEAIILRNQFRNDLAELQKKEKDLSGKIDNLSTDRGMEAEIRNRYRVVRPGEQLVIVVDDAKPELSDDVSDRQSWWKQVIHFIGF